jgi:cell division protein FtsL
MTDWSDGIETRNYGIKCKIDRRMFLELMRNIISLAMVAGTLVFYSWVRNQIIDTGYQSQNLFTEEESLLRAQKSLILEEETLRNPERIDIIARNDLGMTPLHPNQMILPQIEDVQRSLPDDLAMAGAEAADLKKMPHASVWETAPTNGPSRERGKGLTIYD